MTQHSMDSEQFSAPLIKALEDLSHSVGRIASGGGSGPDGLEALAMAVAGDGVKHESLGEAVRDGLGSIADALREGLREVARAIERK